MIGSGLCVFSRYPIMAVHSQQFTTSGALRELTSGEVFSGKGMLSCRIMTPNGPLLFVTTHTNGCCRESQMYEMTKLIDNYRGNDLVVLCGDFNTGDTHPAYRLITTYLGLKDAFAGCSVNTCNLGSNIYTKRVRPARIDFIFYSSDTCPTSQMEVQSKRLALSGNIPGKDFPYSDHEGLEVVFSLNERVEPMPPRSLLLSVAAVEVLEEVAQRICNRKKKFEAPHPHRRAMAIAGGFLAVILLIALILGNNPVMMFLGTRSLGYFSVVGVGILGMCLMWAWLIPMFNITHVNGMETHMDEIRTRLSYNTILAESDGNGYRLM
ncbi:Putative neutral sphingomyelinase [Geodia barretti]|nr:Putative neutral sphingomyelinase [Geodia barretti]